MQYVLIMDITYKKYKYKMSSLDIVEYVLIEKYFVVRLEFSCMKHLCNSIHLLEVIIIDRQCILLHAIDDVFLNSY